MIFSLFLFDAVKNFISLFRCKTKIATRHEFGRPCSLPPTRKTKQNTSVKWVSQRPNWLRYRGRARCCVSPTTTTIAVTRNRWRERRLPRTYAAGDLYGDGRLGLSSAKFERERERERPHGPRNSTRAAPGPVCSCVTRSRWTISPNRFRATALVGLVRLR